MDDQQEEETDKRILISLSLLTLASALCVCEAVRLYCRSNAASVCLELMAPHTRSPLSGGYQMLTA